MEYVDFWPKIYVFLYPSLGNLTKHNAIYCNNNRNIQVAKTETTKDKKDLADKHWRQLEQLQLALNETKVCSFQRFPTYVLHISRLLRSCGHKLSFDLFT